MTGEGWADERQSPCSPDRLRSGAADDTPRPTTFRRFWDGSHVDRSRIRIALLALGVFVLDTLTPVDIAVPVLYVNVVLLAMRSGRRGDVVIAGWGSIGLIVVSFLFTLNLRHPFATSLSNSALSVLATVCVMILCLKNLRSQTEIVRARDRIASVSRGVSLKTLSASVVHEVTQPLTAIGANAEAAHRWMSQTPPNLDETKAATRRIVAEVDRASAVINRLRRLTAAGGITVETCDVVALIETAVEHLRREIDEANVEVRQVGLPHLKIAVDRILIEQVIINALSNSMDALRAGDAAARSIVIETRSLPGHVEIAVKDSGVGLDEDTLERMFDPFFTTKDGSGMGIGLAVSRSIVDAHGGTIRAFPNIPRGLVMEIALPCAGPSLR